MRPVWTLAAAALAAAALGCTGTVAASSDVADAEAASSTAAVVVVQRTLGDTARGEASARFLRTRTRPASDDALRVVGATVDFPALGTCLSLTNLGSATAPEPVQLLDVGAVSMEASGLRTALLARQVPDVVDLVSGVVYTAAADGELLPAHATYALRVAGTQDTEPFAVTASAPGDLSDLRVAQQDARAVSLAPGASAELTWEAGGADDMVYVDVNAAAGSAARMPTIRCAFADAAGRASIASALLPDEGTLSVHRLHRERFRARTIESGEVRFDFARVVAFAHH